MSYKGNTRKIRDALTQILEGIQLNGEPAFVQVISDTSKDFTGFPSALIIPDMRVTNRFDSNYFEHKQNYEVLIHIPLSNPQIIEQSVYDNMCDLSDLIQDTLESDDTANTIQQIDPTIGDGGTYMLNVTQVTPHVATSKTGAMLIYDHRVEFTYQKSSR